MSRRVLAIAALLAVGASAHAQEKAVGTITYGGEKIEIGYAAAHEGPMPTVVDLEFFNKKLPSGETFFSLDSEATAALRGMRLRISQSPAYKNGTWMHPSIEGQDQFYYFDEGDPIVLTYEVGEGRISGSIAGEDQVGGTSVKVALEFDLAIAAAEDN